MVKTGIVPLECSGEGPLAMKTVLIAAVACTVSATSTLAKTCNIPQGADLLGGRQESGTYAFDYSSYFWPNDIGLFEFGRCVYNNELRPLWIEWLKLGVSGTAKGQDRLGVIERTDDKDTQPSVLYFGAAPHEIKPNAVFRPNEIAWQLERIWRAQFDERPNVVSALKSDDDFFYQLKLLMERAKRESFVIEFSASIALPINSEAFRRLKDQSDNTDLSDSFYNFEVEIGEELRIVDDVPKVRPYFRAFVSENDRQIAKSAEPIIVSVEGTSIPSPMALVNQFTDDCGDALLFGGKQ